MAAEYTEISIEEMDKFIKRAFHALHPKRGESRGIYFYDLLLSSSVAIRVWTTIAARSSSAKDLGEGSIKVLLVSRKDDKGLEGKSSREAYVKRTQGWRDNLTNRVETLMEKYDDRAEWWDQWAETRQRGSDADRVYQQEERKEQLEKRERDEDHKPRRENGEGDAAPPTPLPRQYDPERMQGGITDPQMSFLRVLMRGMTQTEWEAVGAPEITRLENFPKGPAEVQSLSKAQASRLIDALKRGNARHAFWSDPELEAGALTTGTYDLRDP